MDIGYRYAYTYDAEQFISPSFGRNNKGVLVADDIADSYSDSKRITIKPFVIFPFAEIEASNTLEKRQLKSKFW